MAVAPYNQTFTDSANVTIHGAGPTGVVVATKKLSLDNENSGRSKPNEPDKNTPATTLEVYESANGMMLGQTSDFGLRVSGPTPFSPSQ